MLVRRAVAAALFRISTIQIGVQKPTAHIFPLSTHRPLIQCLRGGFFNPDRNTFLSSAASTSTKEMSELPKASDVLRFWFGDEYFTDGGSGLHSSEYSKTRGSVWYGGGPEVDAKIRGQFADLIRAAAEEGRLPAEEWGSKDGIIAKILLFDQLSRNSFRGTPEAFAYDAAARELCKGYLSAHGTAGLSQSVTQFLLMPLLHSEHLPDLDLLVDVAVKADMGPEFMSYVHAHRDVVVRFGRYPHRNKHFSRATTPEEAEWLAGPDVPAWAKSQ
mmetsp:Transcript_7966/g.16997  ORF Transcript_7966/g.16997 Transcript_7966/m.16997 type:complete len:273 (-) Transcript_7966:273-1091(-)